ncbi:MAG: autoinducer binding domain-containing protein, partial [Pseudomonadota bacterium]
MNISAGNIFGPENSIFLPLAIEKMHLDEFVSDLQSVSLVEEVWSVLVKQASAAGFEFVTYVNKRAGGRSETPLALSNFPAWWQEF